MYIYAIYEVNIDRVEIAYEWYVLFVSCVTPFACSDCVDGIFARKTSPWGGLEKSWTLLGQGQAEGEGQRQEEKQGEEKIEGRPGSEKSM